MSGCREESCTVADTGVCLLNNDPAKCSNRILDTSSSDEESIEAAVAAPLTQPQQKPRFPLSLTLTPAQTRELMCGRYCRLIGILGAPDAGKTASLVSLYLLAARDLLKGFSFADSRSLMALDEISRGARRWNEGRIPDQMTAHTELAEERTAGFLHLRLKSSRHGDSFDLLLPDLPGEWSTSLVDNERVDRLSFLKRADVIWIMVDGRQLSKPTSRQITLHRTKLLMQRLAVFVRPSPPIILVVTRRDQSEPAATTFKALRDEADVLGLRLDVVPIASFSVKNEVTPGTGISELIAASIRSESATPSFWPDCIGRPRSDRAMMRLRRVESRV